MTTREQAIEIAAMDRAKRCDVNWDRLSEVGREAQRQFHAPTIDALLAAGVIPGEGMVVVDAERWERVTKPVRIFVAPENDGIACDFVGPGSIRFGKAFEAAVNDVREHPGDLDAIPDAPTGEHAGIP